MTYERKIKLYWTLILFFSLSLVMAFIFLPSMPWNRSKPVSLFSSFSSLDVAAIEVGPEVRLEKKEDQWFIQTSSDQILARTDLVEDFLIDLQEAQVVQNMGAGEELLLSFGVLDSPHKIILYNENQEVLDALILGNIRSDGRGSYAVKDGQREVLWIDANFSRALQRGLNQWASLNLFGPLVSLSHVESVEFSGSGSFFLEGEEFLPFKITRGEQPDTWIGEGSYPKDLDFAKVNSKISNLLRISGREVGFSNEQELRNLSHQITLVSKRGTYVLELGTLTERGLPVQVGERRYWLGKFALKDILTYP